MTLQQKWQNIYNRIHYNKRMTHSGPTDIHIILNLLETILLWNLLCVKYMPHYSCWMPVTTTVCAVIQHRRIWKPYFLLPESSVLVPINIEHCYLSPFFSNIHCTPRMKLMYSLICKISGNNDSWVSVIFYSFVFFTSFSMPH